MKNRMCIWSSVCKAFGWIFVIIGAICLFINYVLSIALIPIGIALLLSCAVLEWMDGVTAQLDESKAIQEKQLDVLERIMEKMNRDGATTPMEEPSRDTKTGAGRRMAQIQDDLKDDEKKETEIIQNAQKGFDPQNVADIYRMAQKLRK